MAHTVSVECIESEYTSNSVSVELKKDHFTYFYVFQQTEQIETVNKPHSVNERIMSDLAFGCGKVRLVSMLVLDSIDSPCRFIEVSWCGLPPTGKKKRDINSALGRKVRHCQLPHNPRFSLVR